MSDVAACKGCARGIAPSACNQCKNHRYSSLSGCTSASLPSASCTVFWPSVSATPASVIDENCAAAAHTGSSSSGASIASSSLSGICSKDTLLRVRRAMTPTASSASIGDRAHAMSHLVADWALPLALVPGSPGSLAADSAAATASHPADPLRLFPSVHSLGVSVATSSSLPPGLYSVSRSSSSLVHSTGAGPGAEPASCRMRECRNGELGVGDARGRSSDPGVPRSSSFTGTGARQRCCKLCARRVFGCGGRGCVRCMRSPAAASRARRLRCAWEAGEREDT